MDYTSIILELMSRIQKLETEVAQLKTEKRGRTNSEVETGANIADAENNLLHQQFGNTPLQEKKRDTTRYMFDGAVYLKNRLVLAIVKNYVKTHENLTINQLKTVFEKSLQGSIGVVESAEIASLRRDCATRFFTGERDELSLIDGKAYVCSQWGIMNIQNFLLRAEQLGYIIRPVASSN